MRLIEWCVASTSSYLCTRHQSYVLQLETGHFEELNNIIDRINAPATAFIDDLFGTDEGTLDSHQSDVQVVNDGSQGTHVVFV